MSRERSMARILTANVKLQKYMADILEANAEELAKARNWLCDHTQPRDFPDHLVQLKEPIRVHQQIVHVLNGIARIEHGLARNMGIVFGPEDDSGEYTVGGMLDGVGDNK